MVAITNPVEPLLLTTREATKALALSDRTIRDLIKRGELRCIRQGRAVRFDPSDLRDWIERKKSPPIDACNHNTHG
jgi:excisionase family DNA binding protein